jgi:hypothetical protein
VRIQNPVLTLRIALLFAVVAQAQTTAPVPRCLAPLKEEDVLSLVKVDPEGRVVQFVSTCHVGFVPTVEAVEGLAGAGSGDVVLGAVIADGYSHLSLSRARAELASLKRTIAERTPSNAAVRDAALARLDADFAPTRTRAALVAPKDEFTSDDAYAELKRRIEAGVAALDRRHADDRRALAGRYATELAASIRIPNRLLAALKERKYREEGLALDYLRYDANLRRLMAKVGETEYWFIVPAGVGTTYVARALCVRRAGE